MPIDNGFMAKLRRSGYAGDGPQATQAAEDKVAGADPMDVLRTRYEQLSEQKLHKIADTSHQDHKSVTGQTPNMEKDSYYAPGGDE